MQELYNSLKKSVQNVCSIVKDHEKYPFPILVIVCKDPKDNSIKVTHIDQKRFLLLRKVWEMMSVVESKNEEIKKEETKDLGSFLNHALFMINETQKWDVLGYYFLAIGYMEDDPDILEEFKKLKKEEILDLLDDDVFKMSKGLTAIVRTLQTTAALSFDLETGSLVKEVFTQRGENIYENN